MNPLSLARKGVSFPPSPPSFPTRALFRRTGNAAAPPLSLPRTSPGGKYFMIPPYIGSHYPNVQKITGKSPQKTLGNGRLPAAAHAATPARRSDKRLLEHFQFEMLRISNHTACRFAEKTRFFAHFGPGGAVPPPRLPPFPMIKRSGKLFPQPIKKKREVPAKIPGDARTMAVARAAPPRTAT